MENISYKEDLLLTNSKFKLFFRIMRITCILLVFCISTTFATSVNSQNAKVTISEGSMTIRQLVLQIEKQTNYLFVVNSDKIDLNQEIQIAKRQNTVKDVLNNAFNNREICYKMEGENIILMKVGQQEHGTVIRGKVIDNLGNPIIGASIFEKENKKNGTISGIDGTFKLTIDKTTSEIEISFVGYNTQTIQMTSGKQITIRLTENARALEEVVVVGYGTQKRATITGSVASVRGNELKRSGSMNVSNSFAGRIPGVIATNRSGEPGSDWSNILIRGKGTLNNNSPLIVIDGVANRDGMERLNPNDIESVSVLKDASAAIYGAQAANGVILITTKNGNSSKPVLEYNGSFSLSQNTRTPKLLNAYDWMTYDDEIKAHLGQTPLWKNIKEGYLNGTINKKKYGDTDWMNVIFKPLTPQTRHSLSLRGGNEYVKYYLSGDLTYQKPAYRDTKFDFKTNQFRINIEAKVTKDLSIGLNASARNENRYNCPISTSSIFWEAFQAYPYLYDYYPNGLPGPGIAWGNNLAILTSGKHVGYDKTDDFFLDSKLSFNLTLDQITKGLYISGFAAFDRHDRHEKIFNDVWDTYNYDEINDTYIKQTTNGADNIITLTQSNLKGYTNTYHLQLGYDRLFGPHKISGFIAYEQSKYNGEEFSAWRGYYLSDQLDYLNYGADKNKTNNGSGSISARQNIFGRINYDYLGKYMFEFTLRYDGSMNFANHHRWGTFPGLSAGWRISEEHFMNKINWINDLKLRASWGKLGNDRVDQFQYLSSFNMDDGAILGESPTLNKSFVAGRIGNPNITWERVDSKNIAIDACLWKGLLSFTTEYFIQKRKNILTPKQASIPDYTGLTLPDQNIGKVNNSGLEITIGHENKISNMKYNLSFNMTYTKNKIMFFDEAANTPKWQKRTGYPIDSWLMYKTDGIYQTQEEIDNSPHLAGARPGDIKYVDIDGDKKITSNDKYRDYINNIPRIVWGLNMGIEWKGLEINVLWTGQAKAKQMIIPYAFNTYKKIFNDRWISAEKTPNAKYPAAFNKDDGMNTKYSDFWLYDASFIRLKNLSIAYTFPKKIVNMLYLQNARIYVMGSNLFTLDHIGFEDPETSTVNAGQYYPQQRIYTIGMSLNF